MTREEAIDIIRDTYHTDTELEALKVLIPELKESEGERIRKFLLRLAKRCVENSIDFLGDIKKKDVIDWLEKQKEQKPAEWSKEDEDNLCRVIRVLEDNDSDWKELSNWLKSLRPRLFPKWK